MTEVRDLADVDVTYVDTLEDCEKLMRWLGERREFLAFDLETTGLNCAKDRIRLAQFGDANTGWAVPYENWRGLVVEIFKRYDRPWAAHNLIFDSKFLYADGITVPQHLANCTMVMCHLNDPTNSIALKSASARYVDRRAYAGQGELKQAMSKSKWNWATVPVDLPAYWVYGALDTVLTARLASVMWPKVQTYRNIYEIEMGAIHVLRDAGVTGLQIDMPYVEQKISELSDRYQTLKAQLPCSPLSEAGIIKTLQQRGVKLAKRTEKGNLSVDDDVLKYIEENAEQSVSSLAHMIREARGAYKLLSSYFTNFREMNQDGVLHPNVKVLGARTGRMSVTEPALQTLPRGRVVRDAFIAREGHSLILADFKQIELRVMAAYAGEESMIGAINRGEDLHDFTAAAAFGAGFTQPQRQIAKNGNFSKIYGAGLEKFAMTVGIPVPEAAAFLEKYDHLFPGVRRFQEQVIRQVRERDHPECGSEYGYVTTIEGRRLPVEKSKAYVGVNYLVQSSSTADVIKRRICELDAAGIGDYIRLPVHDELIFEVPDEEVEGVSELIHEVMPDRVSLPGVPLDIDLEVHKRWGDAYADY